MTKYVFLILIICISSSPLSATPICNTRSTLSAEPLQVSSPPAPTPPLPPPLHPKTPPKIVQKVEPTYPPDAKAKGLQGQVVLHVVVDRTGRPEAVRLMSGDPLLGQAAIDAVRQWLWQPVVIDGKPVSVGTKVTVNFKLARDKKKAD